MNKKGAIFSLDAAFAIALILLLANLYLFGLNSGENKISEMQLAKRQAEDASIVGLYLGKDAKGMGLDESLNGKNGVCAERNFVGNAGKIEAKKYCKVIE